jgi:hypothetical protein
MKCDYLKLEVITLESGCRFCGNHKRCSIQLVGRAERKDPHELNPLEVYPI